MRAVHVVVPDGIDDAARPSGGNAYDRRVCRGLPGFGWEVRMHAAPGSWPRPGAGALAALAGAVNRIPDGGMVLVDGLVASAAPEVLVPEASRLRLVPLVHMPLGHGPADGEVRRRERAVLSAAAAVVVTSAWSQRTLAELYSLSADRVHVAEPGAEPGDLARGSASAGTLLSVGAVIPGKGHDVLLDALAAIAALSWRCLCVGSLECDPAFAALVRRRAQAGGIGPRVRFPGPRAGAALARSYGAADLLVLASRAETYGMVVTEALARGVPVVAADVGGVPEALGYGTDGARPGLLVPPGDAAALAAALRAWLLDAALRERLRRAARERRTMLPAWSATTSAVADVLAGAAA